MRSSTWRSDLKTRWVWDSWSCQIPIVLPSVVLEPNCQIQMWAVEMAGQAGGRSSARTVTDSYRLADWAAAFFARALDCTNPLCPRGAAVFVLRHRLSAWLDTAVDLVVSGAANIGHVPSHDFATAAGPPLAAATSYGLDADKGNDKQQRAANL